MRESLKELKAKGVSYSLIAKQVNCSRSLISKYANGTCNISDITEKKVSAIVNKLLAAI